MNIGPYTLENNLILAPMAGITDRPFRDLCRQQGASLAVSEMTTSNPDLWQTRKSRLRRVCDSERGLRSVQIAGTDPQQMAQAARYHVDHGAQIIDINMGCPAKKVCNVMAGSALLRDETLVRAILDAVVAAVCVPVTLKIRTGWCPNSRNGVRIAQIAEQAGVAMLAVHGRTRADGYRGEAEYDTLRAIRSAVALPLVANGDIHSPEKAAEVLALTGADGLMIGRSAQGNPWIFREIAHYLEQGRHRQRPTRDERQAVMHAHLQDLHHYYGEVQGLRIARKHLGWYLAGLPEGETWRRKLVRAETTGEQLCLLQQYFRSSHAEDVRMRPTSKQAA